MTIIQFPTDPNKVDVGWQTNDEDGGASVYLIQNGKKIEMYPMHALEVLKELAGVIMHAEYHNMDNGFDPRTAA